MPTAPAEPLAYRPTAVAEQLGISRRMVYELIYKGDLAAVKCGRSTLITRAEIERFVASLPDSGLGPS